MVVVVEEEEEVVEAVVVAVDGDVEAVAVAVVI